MKVFAISGYSKTGKTTIALQLIEQLKERGYSVAAIKDIHNEDFTMEKEGSNSHRMQKAGAETVFARGLKETYLIRPERMHLLDMLSLVKADWVVIEGMKNEAIPKIITAASEKELNELVDGTTMAISGKISREIKTYRQYQVIDNYEDIEKLCDMVEEKVFESLPLSSDECCSKCGLTCYEMVTAILDGTKNRSDCLVDQDQKITVKIDGKRINMVPFVANLFYDLIHSFLSNLKGYRKGKIDIQC